MTTDAELRARLDRAERENAELRARIAGASARSATGVPGDTEGSDSARHGRRWRGALSALLIVLGAVLAPVAVVGSWSHGVLTDTERFVAEFAPLAEDPAVQRVVTDETVQIIEREVDLAALTAALVDGIDELGAPDAAVSAARALETPITLGLSSLVRSTVGTVVTSDAFSTGWREALRISHAQLTQTLRGDPGAALAIASDGSLGLQLGPVVERVQQALVAQGFEIAAGIPVVDLTIPVAEDVSLSGAQGAYAAVTMLGQWLPWVSLGILAAGVLVARRRRRALVGAALGLAVTMAALLLAIAVSGRIVPALTPLPADAAGAFFDAITGPIAHSAASVLTVALLLVLVGWFTGPATLPTRLRAMSGAGADRLRAIGDRYGVGTGAFGVWCERFQRVLRVVIAAGAGAIVLLTRPLTPGLVIGTLLGAVVALVLLDLLRRPAPDPVEPIGAEAGTSR